MDRTTTAPAELAQFTGLRGLAALVVLFGHVSIPQGITLHFGIAQPFANFGGFGVDAFFVLSGFILCHVYGDRLLIDRGVIREFLAARFARIYPLHVATLVLMFGAYFVSQRAGVTPTEESGYNLIPAILSLLLVGEWFGVVAPNPGSWSISVEFANYLAFPLMVPILARLGKWSPIAIIACAVALANIDDSRTLRGLAEFTMGAGAFYCAREFAIRRTAGLAGLLFLAPFLLPAVMTIQYWHVAICFTACVFLLAGNPTRDPFHQLCAWRPVVFLGEISLSVYLLQWFIWIGWKHVIAKTAFFAEHPYLMVTAAAASVIIVSAFSFAFFERPTRAWLRKRMAQSRLPVLAPSAA